MPATLLGQRHHTWSYELAFMLHHVQVRRWHVSHCWLTYRHAFALLVKAIITQNAKQEQVKTSWSAKICATCRYGLLSKLASGSPTAAFMFQCSCAHVLPSEERNQVCKGLSRTADSGQHQHRSFCSTGNMCGIMQLPFLLSQSFCHTVQLSHSSTRLCSVTVDPQKACKQFAILTVHAQNRSMLRCSRSSISTFFKS